VANETGVAVLDSAGRVVDAGWTRGLEETVDRIVTAAGLPCCCSGWSCRRERRLVVLALTFQRP